MSNFCQPQYSLSLEPQDILRNQHAELRVLYLNKKVTKNQFIRAFNALNNNYNSK